MSTTLRIEQGEIITRLLVSVSVSAVVPPSVRSGVSRTKANEPDQKHQAYALRSGRVLPQPPADQQTNSSNRE
jgi:hypothetical protein